MKNSSILVLGATGFIGSHLTDAFSKQGRNVFAVSRRANLIPASPNITTFAHPIDHQPMLNSLLPKCEFVYHVASDSTPGSTAGQPSHEASLNLLPTLRLLECLQSHPHVRLIYVSSGGTTYCASPTPLNESSALGPQSYHGAAKLALEKFIFSFTRQYSSRATVLRPSNIYGPGQRYKRGFGIIPTIFRHIKDDTPMEIWGSGQIVRDYIYIDDFVKLCLAVSKIKDDDNFDVFNVGTGIGTSIDEICALAEKSAGRTLKKTVLSGRSIDSSCIVLNSNLAKEKFDWAASKTLASGLAETWNWFNQHAFGDSQLQIKI